MDGDRLPQPVDRYGKWILTASISAAAMAFIDVSALHVALPTIQADLKSTAAQLLWILNSYALMLASLLLVAGALGDRFGRKRVFVIGIAIFVIASIACGLAPTSRSLIFARTVQGIGAAVMVPGSLSLIIALFPTSTQGRAIGIWSASTALVSVAGPLLGGLMADAGLWRFLFYLNVPLGLVALAALTQVPESKNDTADAEIDYRGATLATIGLAGITYGFLSVPELEAGFADPQVWLSLIIGSFSLIYFVYWQTICKYPMVPLHLFKSKVFSATNIVTFLLYGAMSIFSFFLSLNLVQIQGYEAREAGLAFLPFAILVVILSPLAGRLSDKYGPRTLLTIGPIIAGLGIYWVSVIGVTNGISDVWTTFFPSTLVFGIGISLTVAPLTTTVMTALPNHYAGTASGVNNAVSRTAGVLAIAIMGGLAIVLFEQFFAMRVADLQITAAEHSQLIQNSSQMAETKIPSSINRDVRQEIQQEIKWAFIDMNRITMQICAALAILSGLISWYFLEPGPIKQTSSRSQPSVPVH